MRTEAIGFIRAAADGTRTIEGIAVPYGVVSAPTEATVGSGVIVREAWAPGAFREDVQRWAARQDGRRAPFRPRHGERPIGTVEFSDSDQGLAFRGSIFDGPRGDEYLGEVWAGLNGVSVEGIWNDPPRKLRDGTLLHRTGRVYGLAGSDNPAFDGAHIALRDMEDDMADNENPAPQQEQKAEPATAPRSEATVQAVQSMSNAERSAAERQTLEGVRPRVQISRAEAIYGPRSEHSYFSDMLHAREGDGAAVERQARHSQLLAQQAQIIEDYLAERAGDVVSSEIPGAYPNTYLPGLLTPRIMKGRPMGGFYSRVPITDAQPKIFPQVTTSTTVAVQAAEGTAPAASDLATTAVTATPLLYGGHTVVSRQVLDGASPSIDQMLMQDLLEAYSQASETVIKTAVEAGSGASGTAITAATPFAGVVGNIVAYQAARFQPAQGIFVPAALYAVLLAQADTTGRMLMPFVGLYNAEGGVTAGGAQGALLGATVFLSWSSTANVVVTARPADFVIFESSIASFRYDQTSGPAGIDIGIWAYLVVGKRLGSLKVTAA